MTVFNDFNADHTAALSRELSAIPGIDELKHRPVIINDEVDDELVRTFEQYTGIPALSFIDPWGYKGLSLRLISAVVKNWGCEAIFFFNFNRINMGLTNPLVEPHMQALFGEDRLRHLQMLLDTASPAEREQLLRRNLGEALEDLGAPYLIPFRFARESGRSSHYICFVSKHRLGYKIMKDIMARKGVVDEDGVPKFEYVPQGEGRQLSFDIDRPLSRLAEDLLTKFAGRTVQVDDIISEHHVGTPFVAKNYKDVLLRLEARGTISCAPQPGRRRRVGTMGDSILVTFPDRPR